MHIEIISDTICPWCFIGKRRLERALAERSGLQVEITWRPFQLNPDMPSEGLDRGTYLTAKFGGSERAEQIYATISAAGAEEGIDFAFEKIARTPNTVNSHRLIRWAEAEGCQDAIVEILFRRYFHEGADIGSHDVLLEVATEAGMDAERVRTLLEEGKDADSVRSEDLMARQMGIAGVPFFIVNHKYAVSGAQDPKVFLQVLDLAEREAEAAADAVPEPESAGA